MAGDDSLAEYRAVSGVNVSAEDFDREDSGLTEPYESMKEALGPHRFEIAYDETSYRNAGEQAVDFTFRMALAKTMRCFGYAIQPMQIDVTSLEGETLQSAIGIVTKMRVLETETNDPWLEDYVFGEERMEANPTIAATANIDGSMDSKQLSETMEYGEGVAEALRLAEPYVGKFARDLGLSQRTDIQHPAIAEMHAQKPGGRAH